MGVVLSAARWTLLASSAVCLAWYAAASAQSALFQVQQRTTLDELIAAARATGNDERPDPGAARVRGGLIGRLEIARLGVSAAVVEGDDPASLNVAIGHLPDTPLPWEEGNSALAAHRDTFFRPLERIRTGDEIRFVTPEGDLLYRVRSTLVVLPEDVWVLAPTGRSTLTLVTCYPFRYVGSAPRRYIVRADRVN